MSPSYASDPGEFSLIVTDVDPAMIDEAAGSLSDAFHLESAVAQQVLKCAPIVFARGLTRHEVKSITPRLVDLSKMGIELRVTARPTGRLPKLNWPIRPQFTAANSGGPKLTPTFSWEDSAFVCPSCGEAYVFKRVGPVNLGDAVPTPTVEPNGGAAPPDSSETYNVTLSQVADPTKVDKAAELIARFQGIPVPEARALTANPVIAVARGVSRSDAQQILEEFKRHRLFGRMSKT